MDFYITYLYESAEQDLFRTYDYNFTIDDFVQSYGNNYQFLHVKQGISEFIDNRKSSINNQIIFENNAPIIYDSKLGIDIISIGDTLNLDFSIYGSSLSVYLFYSKFHMDHHMKPFFLV